MFLGEVEVDSSTVVAAQARADAQVGQSVVYVSLRWRVYLQKVGSCRRQKYATTTSKHKNLPSLLFCGPSKSVQCECLCRSRLPWFVCSHKRHSNSSVMTLRRTTTYHDYRAKSAQQCLGAAEKACIRAKHHSSVDGSLRFFRVAVPSRNSFFLSRLQR